MSKAHGPPADAPAGAGRDADADADASPDELTAPLPDDAAAALGDRAQIGRFRVLRALGVGGMGVVLEAEDPQLERRVAIKVLHVGDGSQAELRRARLVREARAAARLTHPNVITIHDVGTLADGHPFIAMEVVDGGTLAQWQSEARPWREVVQRYLEAAQGLAAAHRAGLVHRDFKPHNVLLGRQGALRVSDFGIAALEDRGASEETAAASAAPVAPSRSTDDDVSADLPLTEEGEILGTPAYMAPEQRASAAVDGRADQYAYCVALHHALTGELPFGDDPSQRAQRALALDFVTPARGRPGPRRLYRLIARGLAPRPEDRFPSMEALIAELEGTLARRRRAFAAVAVGIPLLIAGVALVRARDATPACRDGARALAQTWGPAQRDALAVAFAASGLPDSSRVAARASDTIDRWGASWTAAYDESCRATRVLHTADEATLTRRVACLTSARHVLDGITAALAKSDRAVAGRSPEALLGLPRVEACATLDGGAGAPADPPPNAQLQRDLANADAAITIGKIETSIADIEKVRDEARAAGDRETEAQALLRLGRLQRRAGDRQAAGATLFDAAVAAEAMRRDDLAVEAWAEWLYARRGRELDPAALADGVRRATEALIRAGNPPYLRALLLTNQASVVFTAGDPIAADGLFREALALRETLYGPNDPRVADMLDNLAIAVDRWALKVEEPERAAKRAEARALGERALDIRKRALGDEHPAVARSLQNLAGMYDLQGDRATARAMLGRALHLKEQALGPEHVELTSTINSLADFDESEGKLEAALAGYRRSLALTERATGSDSGDLAFSLLAIAEIEEALGHPGLAAAAFRRRATVVGKPADRRRTLVRALLAEVDDGGALPAARLELSELLEQDRQELPPDDPRRVPGLLAAARLDVRAGEPALARPRLEQVAQILAAQPSVSAAVRADADVTRGELARASGQRGKARALADAAAATCADRACETAGYQLLRRADALRR
ncbi:MAG: serine/threonine-protein kinase [Kofleriaceae bacterium]